MDDGISEEELQQLTDKALNMNLADKSLNALAWSWIIRGNNLIEKAQQLTGDTALAKFAEAGEKYGEAVRLKSDDHEAFNNWGIALSNEARRLDGDTALAKLEETKAKLIRAKQLSNKGNYNLACIHALNGDIEAAVDELRQCLTDNRLPDCDHLDVDDDLDAIREKQGYREFRHALGSG